MRALVLSGGGVKGAFQAGVLKRWMGEDGIDYDILCGVSVGALNAAGLGMIPHGWPRTSAEWLETFWRSRIRTETIYRRWFPFGRLHALWRKSIYDSSPLTKLVSKNLDQHTLAANGRIISVGAVSMDSGEYRFVCQDDPQFVKWVLASSSFPVFLEPVEIEGQLWSDGGIKSVTPLGQALRLGATEIDVIMCNNVDLTSRWSSSSKAAIPYQAMRAVDLMSEQITKNDLELCGVKNELAIIDPRYRKVKVRVVAPEKSLVQDSLNFDTSVIAALIDYGFARATNPSVYG